MVNCSATKCRFLNKKHIFVILKSVLLSRIAKRYKIEHHASYITDKVCSQEKMHGSKIAMVMKNPVLVALV